MYPLTKDQIEKLKNRIDAIITEPEDKTPVDKLNKLMDIWIEQNDGKKTDTPAHEIEDVTEEDIGEFPTVH